MHITVDHPSDISPVFSYQPGGSSGFDGKSDPLSNGTSCLRDAAIMQHLGVSSKSEKTWQLC